MLCEKICSSDSIMRRIIIGRLLHGKFWIGIFVSVHFVNAECRHFIFYEH